MFPIRIVITASSFRCFQFYQQSQRARFDRQKKFVVVFAPLTFDRSVFAGRHFTWLQVRSPVFLGAVLKLRPVELFWVSRTRFRRKTAQSGGILSGTRTKRVTRSLAFSYFRSPFYQRAFVVAKHGPELKILKQMKILRE